MISILLVDDETELLEIARLYLEDQRGFRVQVASSAKMALHMMQETLFDVVVSDYQMPVMDGIQFLIKLRGKKDPIPFIIFTGRGREEIVIEALNEGADFYLQKGGEPAVQFAELSHIIRKVVRQHRAEDELGESEEKYRHLIEHSDEAIVVAQDGMPKLVNHRTVELTGYSEQELLSMSFPAFIHPDDRAMVMERYQKRMKGEEVPSRYAFRLNPKDGSTRWVEIAVSKVDWDGRTATLNFLTDTTGRKRVEEELRQHHTELEMQNESLRKIQLELEASRDQYLDLYNMAPVGYLTTGEAGQIVKANLTAATLLNVDFGTLVKTPVVRFIVPEDQDIYYLHSKEIENTKQQQSFELRLLRQGGSPFWAQIIMVPDLTVGGNESDCNIMVIDITGRKVAEDALRKSDENFRSIFENNSAAMAIIEPDATISSVNKEYCNLSGYTKQEVIGMSWTKQIPPEELERLKEFNRRRLINPDDAPDRYEFSFYKKNGEIKHALMSIAMIQIKKMIASFIDITERKQAEEALAESEALFATAFYSGPLMLAISDIETGIYLNINDTFTRFTGYSRDEAIGKTSIELGCIRPEDRESLLQELKRTGRVSGKEFRLTKKDGESGWYLFFGEIITVSGKKRLLSIAEDITERKRIEETLKESETKYRMLVETLNEGIWVIDKEAVTTFVNPKMAEILGYTIEEMAGCSLFSFMDDEGKRICERLIERRKQGIREQHVFQFLKKDGTRIYTSIETNPIKGKDGEYLGAIAGVTDITERKRMEDALRESEEKYRTLYESSADGIVSITMDGYIREANNAFCAMIGYTLKELGQFTYRDITPEKWHDMEERILREQVVIRGFSDIYEKEYIRKDGSVMPVALRMWLLADEQGNPGGMWTIVRDITERRKKEKEIENLRKQTEFILGATRTGLDIIDSQFNIRHIDPAWQKVYGDPAGRKCHEYFMGRDTPCPGCGILKALETKSITVSEERLPKEGNRPIQVTSIPFQADDGEWLVAEVNVDITERKVAEEALVSAQESLKEVNRQAHIGTWDWIIKNDTVTWSEELYNIAGRDPTLPAPTYAEHLRVYKPASWDLLSSAVTRALATGEPYNLELELVRPDGSIRWVNAFGGIKCDGKSKVIGLHGTVQDTTGRKQAEEALRESEEKYRVFFNNEIYAVCIFDLDTLKLLDVNNAYTQMYGYTRDELLSGMTIHDITVEHEVSDSATQKARDEGTLFIPLRYHKKKDGTIFPVEIVGGPYEWKGKQVMFVLTHDITDRKQAEEALRESETRYRTLSEASPDQIFINNREGTIQYVNSTALKLFNLTYEQVVGKTRKDLFPPEIAKAQEIEIQKVFETGERVHREDKIQFGQKELWIDVNLVPLKDAAGNITSVLGIARDITERKNAEEALQKSEERFRAMVESAFEGTAIISAEGVTLYENPAVEQIAGLTPDKVIGTNFFEYVHPDDMDQTVQTMAHLVREPGLAVSSISRIKFPDGSYHYVEYTSTNLIDNPGVGGIVVNFRDITERKRAEEALAESEKKYRDIFEKSVLGLFRTAPDGRLIDANDALARMYGYSGAAELLATGLDIGRDIYANPEDRHEVIRILAENRIVENYETRHLKRDGTRFWVSISARIIRETEGNMLLYEGTIIDITGRKVAEVALKESEDILKRTGGIARVGGWEMDAETLAVTWTEETFLIHEVPLGQVPPLEGAIHFFHPDDQAKLSDAITCALTTGEGYDMELRFITATGKHLWTRTLCQPQVVEGKTIRLIGTIQDITDRKRAEAELQTSKDLLSNAMEMAHLGHWEYDVTNDVFTFNDQFYKIFRTTVEQVGGYAIPSAEYARRFVHPDDMNMVGEETRKAIEATDPHFNRQIEHRMLYADGTFGHIAVRFFIIKDSHGRTVKTYGVNQDITERKKAEETIRHALAEKEILLQEIHHRVKNNLAGIIALIELQTSSLTDPAFIFQFKDLETRIRSMALVHESLCLTKDLAQIDVASYTDNLTRHLIAVYGDDPKIQCRIDMGEITMSIDTAMPCGLVMTEIVTNSLKYAFPDTFSCEEIRGEPCTISITMQREGSDYLLTVADNGIGIPPGINVTMASSLGLYLIGFIVEHQLQGTLEINITRGTAYTIRFPEPETKEQKPDE